MASIRVALDTNDLRELLAGRNAVGQPIGTLPIEIYLTEISWTKILEAVRDAMREHDVPVEQREHLLNAILEE